MTSSIRSIILASASAAALAAPSAAGAYDGPPHPGDYCPLGQISVIVPGTSITICQSDPTQSDDPAPDPSQGGGSQDDSGGDGSQSEDLPEFLPSFLNRTWRFSADADGYEDGELGATLSRIISLPAAYAAQDDELVGQDLDVLAGAKVKVYNRAGRRIARAKLDQADRVVAVGKLLPPEKWAEDEDGEAIPTVRAKRITVTKWDVADDAAAGAAKPRK